MSAYPLCNVAKQSLLSKRSTRERVEVSSVRQLVESSFERLVLVDGLHRFHKHLHVVKQHCTLWHARIPARLHRAQTRGGLHRHLVSVFKQKVASLLTGTLFPIKTIGPVCGGDKGKEKIQKH